MEAILCAIRRNIWHIGFGIFFFLLFHYDISMGVFNTEYLSLKEDVLIGMAGTLLGFVITALSLFYAMPIKQEVKQNLKHFGFDVIIPRTMFIAIALYVLTIVLFFFQASISLLVCLFFFGLCETFVATVYLVVLSKKGS